MADQMGAPPQSGQQQPGYPPPPQGQYGGYPAPQQTAGGPSGPRAGFWQRFGAYLLDVLLLGVISGILQAALKGAGTALSILITLAYFSYFEGGASGQTLGKRAVGIRVIDFANGGPIGYGRALVRTLGRYVSGLVILLGYLWMLWDKEKQTWHDKFANDVVVPVAAYPPPAR